MTSKKLNMLTPQFIENKLIDFYLKTTGPYGHSVMRSIDVTEEVLIQALEGIDDPIKTFESLIKGYDAKAFYRFLAGEVRCWGVVSRFRYIVYLCYIAAHDGFDSENFREKLQKKLGLSSPPRLDGVNLLFRQLSEFTCKNEQYRKVEIPVSIQSHMKLIGIIYEFSFPNWRLHSILSKNLSREKEYTPESLRQELLWKINEFKHHQGLYQAIHIFTKRVSSKNKFLEEDPFWSFYLKWSSPQEKNKEKIYFYLTNCLDYSYFDFPEISLKVCELNERNSNFFTLKNKNKSFERKFFCFKDLGDKYELINNINKIEEVDAILYHFDSYHIDGISKEKMLISQKGFVAQTYL